ncbi:hypothetical protein GGS23DRAFT_604548 [Durotheca rogersii]|uniref:uncharacterized protein n=1 Tax=Durotheca rogersii TaxID=419775 RepID=UPI00221FC02F|nr:uncharacterized protein GGS23DRAFT_604548 [Durotheca rogersii]KAI5864294.1 hypothetical protein GGS23DRAFT_604548 [Durotheca rogersii]
MGKITKTIQAKHKETLSPWLQEFVDAATSAPAPLLPKVLATFPSRWPFPRGDLYHWIPLLNRFDALLESFCSTYKLNEGPQTRDFGCEVLRGSNSASDGGGQPSEPENLSETGYSNDGDVYLIVAILKFTQMLLDHCGNRSIYASSSHLNDLLNSTDFTIICATLRVGVELAQRYQASVKRIHGMATRQVHTTLLSNHYNIDLDRVQQLAQPFVKTPILKPSEHTPLTTPGSANKGKEKSHSGSPKNVATMYANDLCALAKADTAENSGSQTRWNGWGDVKLTYYPTPDDTQGSTQQPFLHDRGASNVPATPTPLRRSSTSTATQSTPRASRQGVSEDSPVSTSRFSVAGRDEGSLPGQKTLEISHVAVGSTSIYELLARMPVDLAKESKYELLNRLRVAKALTGSIESRRQALKARLLAIQNLAYIHIEPTFIEKLVYQLAELIHPAADGAMVVPIDLQSIATSLLEAIASFQHKLPDIFSALNATVNHGVLLYVIRKAQWTEEDEWRDSLFSLTLHITMAMANNTSRNLPEIISAGLLDIMVEILNLRSNIAERTYGTLVGFLDTLVNADGLEAITNLVTYEGRGTLAAHRSQQQNLKFLLKFIHHLMTNAFAFGGNTDRLLRNLVDKSALLRSIREIIENMAKFGSLVWTNAVTILTISESGLIQSYLEALTGRPVGGENRDDNSESPTDDSAPDLLEPDNRPHPPSPEMLEAPRDGPLARGILPSTDPITIVPTVLNAICLNNLGMKMVIFESPEHVRVMAADENLARHHPSLRPAIANAVLDMVARVTHLARLLVNDSKEPQVVPDKGKGKALATIDDTDGEDGELSFRVATADTSSITPYIFAVSNFLAHYVGNSNLKINLINSGGIELLLDLSTAPSLPHDFGDTVASRNLQSVVSQLVETTPIIGLPSLLKRTQAAIDVLNPVTQAQDTGSYFLPFLRPDIDRADRAEEDVAERLSRGTDLAKALLNTQSLIKTLYQCFPFSSRAQTVTHLIKSLGPLLRAVILEEAAISNGVPENWSARRPGQSLDWQNPPNNPSTSGNGNPAHSETEDSSLPDVLSSATLWKLATAKDGGANDGPSKSEQSSPRYQNYRTLRLLLHSLMPATFPLFQTLGKSLLPRRERDQYLRVHHLQLAEDLAQTILEQFELPDREKSIHEMLVNRTIETRDRQSPSQIIAPVLIAFKKYGGLELLNAMLRTFKHEICKEHKDGEEESMSRLAVIGMKKILDLYSMIINGKTITDSVGQINILPRNMGSSDRRADGQVAPNLIVELRMAVLPVLRELWDSPLVEKGSAHILAKIISILKSISQTELEATGYRRSDKTLPPAYLQPTPLRFSWSNISEDTREVVNECACSEDLAQEGIYRANGNRALAYEYCKAHKSSPDLPDNAENEPAPPTEHSTHMRHDLAPGMLLEEDILGELREAAALSNDNDRDTPIPPLIPRNENGATSSSTTPAQDSSAGATREDLDEERNRLRSNLIERCLDVVRAHPDSTHEVSELISGVLRTSDTLTNALMSFAENEELEVNGRSIAAYAHLLSLLLQERGFFRATVNSLRDNVKELLQFLQNSTSASTDEHTPWTPYILLIFEILLGDDEQPGEIRWKSPASENDPIEPLQWSTKDLNAVLHILPRIGKEESLAVSVLRILVILTRDRSIARQVGDKKNLQGLFVTAKQLSGAGSSRLSETRIASHILTILRHIIEDEEVIKQMMRSEIQTYFDGSRNGRPLEPANFTRTFSHIALRDPALFIEVCNETSNLGHAPKDDVAPAVRATEDFEDKLMADTSKPLSQDSKRPVLENPDGVEVDDKEVPQTTPTGASEADNRTAEGREKKNKPSFKAEEHPIFIYRCFLLHCLTELLQSYNRTKVEFINFKRGAPLFANTPVKPRSSVLNYLLNDLLYPSHMDGTSDTIAHKKRYATSVQAQNLLVALVGRTGEKPIERNRDKYDYEDEPDLLFVRKFVLDTILRSYKDAATSSEPFDNRYSRMLALSEIMHLMMGDKDKDAPMPARGGHDSLERSQAQIRRLMYEKGYLAALTSSIADIDLAFPPVKRTIKYILRVLRILTSTAIYLSHSNIIPAIPTQGSVDEEVISASSLSDIDDDREETPDLYRNSALGMLEPGRDREGDYSEESEDDDDEEMYDDEYDDDMGYESEDREEDVSERDEDDELQGMGPIEGLSGDHGVIEVTMGDEDEDDDDMDEDDEDDGSEDEIDSDDIDEVEDRIEIVDDEGNPLEDDGVSGWESETDGDEAEEDEDEEGEEVDYDAEAQDLQDAAGMRDLDDVDGLGRFGNIMRAIEEEDFEHPEDLNALNDRYMEDEEEEEDEDEEDDMDDEYAYEDDFPNDAPPRDVGAPSLGWDTLVVEPHGTILGHHHRHRHGTRSPFPPIPFMMGTRDSMNHFGDPRGFSRSGRHDQRPVVNEDGLNPLLRRGNDAAREGSPRPSHLGGLVRLGFPGGLFGGANIDSPMSFINDLVASLPASLSRNAHALHFQITHSPREGGHDMLFPFGPHLRESRSDSRRDAYQEPTQAASFSTESTVTRWTEEVKMIFGVQHSEKSQRLVPAILSYLVPPAIQREKELKAKEAERQRQQEEERKKREEEERKAREAKEAEEKAAQEKQEAEERERAAAESAAQTQTEIPTHLQVEQNGRGDPEAMEGIETSDEGAAPTDNESVGAHTRAFTTIRGEQVDITELGIDPDYLEALPEEFREEVIAQTVSTRRAQAREAPGASGEQTEVFQEFLEALPEDLRREIVQQELAEQRRREREETRRQTAEPQDMDTASILMTFPPALREQVLMDQGADIIDSLPPDLAAQARRLVRSSNPVVHNDRASSGASRPRDNAQIGATTDRDKPHRKTVVQMLDKPGVATLLRLMFINMKGGSIETSLKYLFKDVCENRQTRFEVVSTLLQILQDGSTDVDAVERSFAQLSIKARQPKEKDAKIQALQGLKRTSTNISSGNPIQAGSETSPLLIVQQCLDLLCYLADQNVHVPSLFLTEHEAVNSSVKRSLGRKGKAKDTKAHKYAINSLLALLDRELLLSRKEAAEAIKNLDSQTADVTESSGTVVPADSGATTANIPDSTQSGNADGSERLEGRSPSGPVEASESAPTIASVTEAESSKTEKQSGMKRMKQLHPPIIPDHNLTLIINIFVARECSSKTFKETLSTIKNLSVIPGAMLVFGEELARQAQLLSEKIVVHLDDLLPHIQNAASGTEIQGVALAKFSPGASDQNKLLRVLTALDHLFAQKKADSTEGVELTDDARKQDLLATLYRNATFNALWEKLSACLSAIRQRESLLNVATILLPLIEALMVVCKDTAQNEAQTSQGQISKDIVLSSPQPESQLATLFFTFTEEHRRILNELVRNNPSLMKGTFSHLVKNPKVLEFDNKRNWFNRSVHNKQHLTQRPHPLLQLQVRRELVFHDSFRSLYFKTGDEMKFGKLSIRFHGEEGVDAGGVTREWFQVLARQMFDANYALFVPVSSDRTTFHPNKLSGINDEHLMFFKFIGRIIGKALYEGRLLDCYFSRAVYKRILGKPVSVKDMESFDPDYYKSLSWMLSNDITDIITETFSVEDDEFGVTKIHDLIENGRNVPVTEENKHDYVRLVVEHKLLTSVKDQMENFLKGFHEIIPAELISIFNEQELELLISGLPDVDIDDWKSNTEYSNYTPSSPQIQWFWRALRSFDKEERAKLLQFVTGTSKVPLNGFKELEGMNGINRFNIHRDYGNKDRLPSSHTCFNQLDLPEYESYDILRRQLIKAITTGSDYFGFA